MSRPEIRIRLTPSVHEALCRAVAEKHPGMTPSLFIKDRLRVFLEKSGVPVGPELSSTRELLAYVGTDMSTYVASKVRHCRVCKHDYPLGDFFHPRSSGHTVCKYCVEQAIAKGERIPGTPTQQLAAQYHRNKCMKEWTALSNTATAENPVPQWRVYFKRQQHRKAANMREYQERVQQRNQA